MKAIDAWHELKNQHMLLPLPRIGYENDLVVYGIIFLNLSLYHIIQIQLQEQFKHWTCVDCILIVGLRLMIIFVMY